MKSNNNSSNFVFSIRCSSIDSASFINIVNIRKTGAHFGPTNLPFESSLVEIERDYDY